MQKRMTFTGRVLLTTDAIGGVWTYSTDLARHLAERGAEVDLVVLGPSPSILQQNGILSDARFRVTLVNLPLDWTAHSEAELEEASEALFALCAAMTPDLIHLNTPGLACRGFPSAPMVVGLHSCVASWWSAVHPREALPADLDWRTKAVRSGLARADGIIVPSVAFGRQVTEIYRPDCPVAVVHNGRTDDTLMSGTRDLIFTAGRLWDEGKNVAVLDRAAGLLPVDIYAAGSTRAPTPGAGQRSFEHLCLLGDLSAADMRAWLSQAGIFVSSAVYEPFGLGVLEAAQMGCALVLSDIPTFRELWDGAAVFVEPQNAEGFAAELSRLREDRLGRDRMGRLARIRAERYGLTTMGDRTIAFYREVLLARAGPAIDLQQHGSRAVGVQSP